MRKNFDKLKIFLKTSTTVYDIIVLAETWIDKCEEPQFGLPGYSSILQQRHVRRSGGIAIYIKNEHKTDFTCTKFATNSHESIILHLKVAKRNTLKLLASYRNCRSHIDEYLDFLEEQKSNFNLLIGDINQDINELNDLNHDSIKYVNFLESTGFLSHNSSPTRVTNDTATCIDHCFAKPYMGEVDNESVELGFSDHKCLLIKLKDIKSANRQQSFTFCDMRAVKMILNHADWSDVYSSTDVNEVYTLIKEKINYAKNEATETKAITGRNRKRNEWVTDNIIQMSKKKYKLYKLVQKYPFNTEFQEQLDALNLELKRKIKTAKCEYYDELYKNAESGKEFWKITNSLLKKKGKDQIKAVNINGTVVERNNNEQAIASHFNTYFATVAEKVLEPLNTLDDTFESYNKTKHSKEYNSSMRWPELKLSELEKALAKMKNSKSAGDDNITPHLLKECKEELLQPLFHFCKLSLSQGIYPGQLKNNIIIPIHKSGDDKKVDNYRPLYITSSMGKLLETIVQMRIYNYLENINFFCGNQHGFRKGFNTTTALYSYLLPIVEGLEKSQKALACHIDLSKCFDTVNRTILLDKLSAAGVKGTAFKWLSSYLRDRTQVTKIGETLSDLEPLNLGILQGSGLGPTLFLVFINDLYKLILNGYLIGFADDGALVLTHSNVKTLKKMMNEDVKQVMNWIRIHKLVPNVNKTNVIEYSYDTKVTNSSIVIKNHVPNCDKYYTSCDSACDNNCTCDINNCSCEILENVNVVKYLGLYLDRRLDWKEQTKHVGKVVRPLSFVFYNLKKFLPKDVLVTIYKTWYQSRLMYGLPFWGGTFNVNLKPLITCQKMIVKTIYGNFKVHSEQALQSLKILPLPLLYKKSLISIFQKYLKENSVQIVGHTRYGGRGHFLVPNYNKTSSRRFAGYQAIVLVNTLVRTNAFNFSQSITNKVLNEYFLSVIIVTP